MSRDSFQLDQITIQGVHQFRARLSEGWSALEPNLPAICISYTCEIICSDLRPPSHAWGNQDPVREILGYEIIVECYQWQVLDVVEWFRAVHTLELARKVGE